MGAGRKRPAFSKRCVSLVSQSRITLGDGRSRRPDHRRDRTAAWFSARGKGMIFRFSVGKARVG